MNEAVLIFHASEIALQHAKTFYEIARMSGVDSSAVAIVTKKMQRGRRSKVKPQKENELFNCKKCGRRHTPNSAQLMAKFVPSVRDRIILPGNAGRDRAKMSMYMQWRKRISVTHSLLEWRKRQVPFGKEQNRQI